MKKHRKVEDNNLSWASRRNFLDEYSQDIMLVFFLFGTQGRGGGLKECRKYDVIFNLLLCSNKGHAIS